MKLHDAVPIDSDETVPMEKTVAGTEEEPILLERVETKQKTGPIEAQFELDEETQQEVADAVELLRLNTIESMDIETTLDMLRKAHHEGMVTLNVINPIAASHSEDLNNGWTTQPLFKITLPTGWVGLYALERMWDEAMQDVHFSSRTKAMDTILRLLVKLPSINKSDAKRFKRTLQTLNISENNAYDQIHNAWEIDSPTGQENGLQALWNEWTTIITTKPTETPAA